MARIPPVHLATHGGDAQNPSENDGKIIVERPPEIGTELNEVVYVWLLSQQRLRHAEMATGTPPTGFTDHVESPRPDPDAQDQPHIVCYALTDPTVEQPEEWVFETEEEWGASPNLVRPIVQRYKHVDRTDPFGGGTPTWARATSAEGQTTATAPAVTPGDEKSVRLCPASARRSGSDWSFAAELIRRSPEEEETASHAAIGEEPVTGTSEMGARDLGHDNLGGPGGYRWCAGNVLPLGMEDGEAPGAPLHAGTKAVSWRSALLKAADAGTPHPATSIEVYRHTATMAGDPVENGELIHTFSPAGEVVHDSGWTDEQETYFLQLRAVNAEGATLGPEFTVRTWREPAWVLTDDQTLVVPLVLSASQIMRILRIDVGSAARETGDLTTTPSLNVKVYNAAEELVGEATYDSLAMVEHGVQKQLLLTEDIVGPQEARIHLTNTGRVVAVSFMEGLFSLDPAADGPGVSEIDLLGGKAWAFVLDGHVFYVLNDLDGKTFVCDLTTGQWHHWYTGDEPLQWNLYRGMMWRGRAIGGDAALGKLWELDPDSVLDEETLQIKRTVTAFQPLRGKASARQGSLRVTASMGEPSADPAKVLLRFTDNEEESWGLTYERTLAVDAFGQVLRYRSLGRIRAPGRIWEVSDKGGLVRIEGVDSDLEGE